MPQPKSNPGSGSGGSRRKRSAGTSSTSGAGGSSSARSRKAPAKRGSGATSQRSPSGTAAQRSRGAGSDGGDEGSGLPAELVRQVVRPLNIVMLTAERIQEAMDDAVERGRMTREDATTLVSDLVLLGRKQTEEVLADLEQLLARRRDALGSAASVARKAASSTASRARKTEPVDRVLRQADRARRVAGVGPSFPILGYDDLTAAQVGDRLDGLSPVELRKVRDYERRHANRKSVLGAIEKALA